MKSSKEGGWGVCEKLSILVRSKKVLGHAVYLPGGQACRGQWVLPPPLQGHAARPGQPAHLI